MCRFLRTSHWISIFRISDFLIFMSPIDLNDAILLLRPSVNQQLIKLETIFFLKIIENVFLQKKKRKKIGRKENALCIHVGRHQTWYVGLSHWVYRLKTRLISSPGNHSTSEPRLYYFEVGPFSGM